MIDTTQVSERALRRGLSHLDALEAESVFIMREVAAECERPVLLFSGGKDSIVLLRIAEKAFRPAKFPFAVMHIDTGNHGWVVATLGAATLAILAGLLIAGRVGTHDRYAGVTMHRHAFFLVSLSTFVLACAAFALALVPA